MRRCAAAKLVLRDIRAPLVHASGQLIIRTLSQSQRHQISHGPQHRACSALVRFPSMLPTQRLMCSPAKPRRAKNVLQSVSLCTDAHPLVLSS